MSQDFVFPVFVSYNDVLGNDIINLARSISLGAVTGGASVALEAGLAGAAEGVAAHGLRGAATGALTGLRSSVPSLSRAAVAGGVATGVSHIVGAGPVGNVIAGTAAGLSTRGRTGIIGGAVSGAANNITDRVRGTRLRRPNDAENQPFEGTGHIVGGNRTGRSNLVEPEINVPNTSEITMEQIMRNAKRATSEAIDNIKEKAAVIGDTVGGAVDNIRHRLIGRGRKGGTYARLQQDEALKRFDQDIAGNENKDINGVQMVEPSAISEKKRNKLI